MTQTLKQKFFKLLDHIIDRALECQEQLVKTKEDLSDKCLI